MGTKKIFQLGVVGAVVFTAIMFSKEQQVLGNTTAPSQTCEVSDGSKTWTLTREQAKNAAIITSEANRANLPTRAVTIGIATALQESYLENLDYGDRDSLGMFQQRPSQGWGTPEQVQDPYYASAKFFSNLVKVDHYLDLPLTQSAQAVQRSAFPDAYAKHEPRADAWARALAGETGSTLQCSAIGDTTNQSGPDTLNENTKNTFLTGLQRNYPNIRLETSGITNSVVVIPNNPAEAWKIANWVAINSGELKVQQVLVGNYIWFTNHGYWKQNQSATENNRLTVFFNPS